ncbi:hypothetical protein [Coleofasciculus sp. E2-BRE-01]|uniref:hypothetical protein n=1 Tax=Coleofasciculus sp. E2-BRE-01 TaxID=3069524 RepID=UPI0040640030
MMASKPNSKNTKAEILESYEELWKERKELESKLKQLQKEVKNNGASQNGQHAGIVSKKLSTASDKMTATMDCLVELQVGFGGAVSELSEKLTTEAASLQELRQAVAEETQQLEALYDLDDIEEDTLDELIETYEENSKAFEAELSQQREALEQEIQDLRQAWQKEQAEHQQAIKERNEDYQRSRQRDEQEYKYDLELRRNLDQDTYEQQQKTLYKELEEANQAQQQQWEEREKAIAQQEKTFDELKSKVDAFDQEKEAAVKKAKEQGKAIANNQVKVKADLQQLEIDGQKRFYDLRIESLQETIENQEARIENLSKQLDAALKQVQDLAVKAIEGTSNSNSYQALKEIALEQAKGQTKNK